MEKNNARKELTEYLRFLVGKYITGNDLVTDGDRESLGLTVKDKEPSPRNIPDEQISLAIESKNGEHILRLRFSDPGMKRAIPKGADGYEIYRLFDKFSNDTKAYEFIGVASKNPFKVNYDNTTDIGRKVWYCVRFYNKKGETGHWSNFAEAVII